MKKLRKAKNILKNERGQGMLEYVLLLVIVVGLVVAFKDKITPLFSGATDQVDKKMNDVFK